MTVWVSRKNIKWNRYTNKDKLEAVLKSLSEEYMFLHRDRLKQEIYEDAAYFKGSADAMKALTKDVYRGQTLGCEYEIGD